MMVIIMHMTEEQLEEYLAQGHEVAGVEFKAAGPRTSRLLQAKVVKAAMGMSNHRDGGKVIIGVNENNSVLTPVGLIPEHLKTWQHDAVATTFASYVDPSIEFETEVIQYKEMDIVVLHVLEFGEIPVLCKKQFTVNGHQELKEGGCYVRSRRKPETSEVSTQEDMRELLDLATEKGIRKWIGQGQRAGFFLSASPTTPTDLEQFESQLGSL